MTRYKIDKIDSRSILQPEDIEEILDAHAANGWEVVSVCRTGFVDGRTYYLITLRRNTPDSDQDYKDTQNDPLA